MLTGEKKCVIAAASRAKGAPTFRGGGTAIGEDAGEVTPINLLRLKGSSRWKRPMEEFQTRQTIRGGGGDPVLGGKKKSPDNYFFRRGTIEHWFGRKHRKSVKKCAVSFAHIGGKEGRPGASNRFLRIGIEANDVTLKPSIRVTHLPSQRSR